jgi:hypothetical protein
MIFDKNTEKFLRLQISKMKYGTALLSIFPLKDQLQQYTVYQPMLWNPSENYYHGKFLIRFSAKNEFAQT